MNRWPADSISRKIKVLMYHRVVDDERLARAHWMCTHIRDFRNQLRLLDRLGFTTITFDDYRLHLQGEVNLPRRPVILTFDDGYLDTYEAAFPALRESGMKAVVFVVADQQIMYNI